MPAQSTPNQAKGGAELLEQGTNESTPEERLNIYWDCVSDEPIKLDELRQKGSGREAVGHVGNINKTGTLRHSPPSPGTSVPMYYIRVIGSELCVHV